MAKTKSPTISAEKTQIEKFKEKAIALNANNDETAFDVILRRVSLSPKMLKSAFKGKSK